MTTVIAVRISLVVSPWRRKRDPAPLRQGGGRGGRQDENVDAGDVPEHHDSESDGKEGVCLGGRGARRVALERRMIAVWPDNYTGSDLCSNYTFSRYEHTDEEEEEIRRLLRRQAHLKETRDGAMKKPVEPMNPRREGGRPIPHFRTMVGRRRK